MEGAFVKLLSQIYAPSSTATPPVVYAKRCWCLAFRKIKYCGALERH